MSEVTREEFSATVGRLHEKVNAIKTDTALIQQSASHIKESTDNICNALYGNGKDGLITKVSNLFTILKIHWGVMVVILSGLLTTAFFVIRTYLIK